MRNEEITSKSALISKQELQDFLNIDERKANIFFKNPYIPKIKIGRKSYVRLSDVLNLLDQYENCIEERKRYGNSNQ